LSAKALVFVAESRFVVGREGKSRSRTIDKEMRSVAAIATIGAKGVGRWLKDAEQRRDRVCGRKISLNWAKRKV